MPETAPVVTQHEPWCVREHKRGACSEKRGHWDRSSNTWQSDMTDNDREVMAEALRMWKEDGKDIHTAMEYVRLKSDTLQNVVDESIRTWWMTKRRMEGMGRSWPIPKK